MDWGDAVLFGSPNTGLASGACLELSSCELPRVGGMGGNGRLSFVLDCVVDESEGLTALWVEVGGGASVLLTACLKSATGAATPALCFRDSKAPCAYGFNLGRRGGCAGSGVSAAATDCCSGDLGRYVPLAVDS
jgi:hypothetical protein